MSTAAAEARMRASTWGVYLIIGTLAAAVIPALSDARFPKAMLYAAGVTAATMAIFAGIRLHRPERPLSWYLLGAGLSCWVMGLIGWNVYEFVLHRAIPFPSISDVAFLVAYPLKAAGLMSMGFRSDAEDRGGWLDAAVVSIGLGGLSWIFFIAPQAQDPSLTTLQRVVAMAYPAGDLLLFALLVRRVLGHHKRTASDWLLTIGLAVLVVADSVWVSRLFGGTFTAATPLYTGWLLFVAAWGAAALHPSMARIDVVTEEGTPGLSPWRLAFLTAAALVPLGVLFLHDLETWDVKEMMLVAMSAVMFVLILLRARFLTVDVSVLRNMQTELRASEQKYRDIVETTTEWIWETDPEGRHTYSNPGVSDILGYTYEELLGRYHFDLVHPDDREQAATTFSREFSRRKTGWTGWTIRWRHKDGGARWLESNAVPVFDENSEFIGYRGTDRDVTERRKLEDELSRQALYDSLTELPNRMLFRDRLEHALAGALRHGRSVAVLMVDLNGFKAINDTFGHDAGDQLLAHAARRIQSSLRPNDTAARLGGDEFAVLLDGATVGDAKQVAERILQSLRDPIRLDQNELFIDATIGIAESPHGSVQGEAILRDADAAMYAAKSAGRRRIEVYRPELHNEVLERFELVTDLRRALERNEFSLRYQPIVMLENEQVRSLEALIRWVHPTRGLVPPMDFITIAEQTGMVVHLDRWVMRQACEALRGWQDRFPSDPPLSISVNVSARQLQDPELIREVERSLRETGLDAAAVTLEITESVLMQDNETTAAILEGLKSLGVRLAIDDFGIGFSSLSYLRRLPVDVVKIDRSFVSGVAAAAEEWTLARGIIKLVHGLGLQTVAEGVERAEQKAHLRALGCRLAQGYYFARPMEEDDVTRLLEERSSRTA